MDYIALSKEVSYALRHAPWEYELEMDEKGWVQIEQLIEALHRDKKWEGLQQSDLVKMIEVLEKKRHEISGDKIRAFYGHSIPMHIIKEKEEPPQVLFHGTAQRFVENIIKDGLLPMSRQYVHLSIDIETASVVGKRHGGKVYILQIDAKKAWQEGIPFYHGNEKVWLADQIPSRYIQIVKQG